ncbi:MAG: hypothetical protein RIQ48_737 [Pseudomonadota bacterium]|jgi:hypothetical protein
MKISIYSTAFNIIKNEFNYEDAIKNYLYYADELCLAVNKSEDDSLQEIINYVDKNNLKNVKIIPTDFKYDDPFCYGKIVNAALQACTGDICILQDLDERLGGNKDYLINLCQNFLKLENIQALFVPVINLYQDINHYKDISFKWYIHKKGLYRGPVNFGIKENGLPDYNKTSTDELIDKNGNLVPTINIVQSLNFKESIDYIELNYPFIYHLGYTDFHKRVKRNNFWKPFWEKATGGDSNTHVLNVNDLYQNNLLELKIPKWSIINI